MKLKNWKSRIDKSQLTLSSQMVVPCATISKFHIELVKNVGWQIYDAIMFHSPWIEKTWNLFIDFPSLASKAHNVNSSFASFT
jgi:hypothetical protein